MTFLLFVASVVVLEYLLRDVRQNSGSMPETSVTNSVMNYNQMVSSETSTADLLSLGQALEAQKASRVAQEAGEVVDSEHASVKESAVHR